MPPVCFHEIRADQEAVQVFFRRGFEYCRVFYGSLEMVFDAVKIFFSCLVVACDGLKSVKRLFQVIGRVEG